MDDELDGAYPAEAYGPDEKLWWDRSQSDGPRGSTGARPRAASWLIFNVKPGERFTTEQVRRALGSTDEHFQRRLRELRAWDWVFDGMKDLPGLNAEYLMREHGWWPGSKLPKPEETGAIDSRTRRHVLDRDGSRCVICGVGAGENYPDPPHTPARITIGHIVPASQGGSNRTENLRCECARCNETVRAESGSGESSKDLIAAVRTLKSAERNELFRWIKSGTRERNNLDRVYDRIRLASAGERDKVLDWMNDRLSL